MNFFLTLVLGVGIGVGSTLVVQAASRSNVRPRITWTPRDDRRPRLAHQRG